MARLTINLDEKLKDKIENNAANNNQSLSQYVVSAIEYYIDEFSPSETRIDEMNTKIEELTTSQAEMKRLIRSIIAELGSE